MVVVEHLDGSAVAAKYRDEKGKKKWITHAFAERPFDDTPISDRSKQLRKVTITGSIFLSTCCIHHLEHHSDNQMVLVLPNLTSMFCWWNAESRRDPEGSRCTGDA